MTFVTMATLRGKKTRATVIKPSEQTGNAFRIMPLTSPSGSTLQWSAGMVWHHLLQNGNHYWLS